MNSFRCFFLFTILSFLELNPSFCYASARSYTSYWQTRIELSDPNGLGPILDLSLDCDGPFANRSKCYEHTRSKFESLNQDSFANDFERLTWPTGLGDRPVGTGVYMGNQISPVTVIILPGLYEPQINYERDAIERFLKLGYNVIILNYLGYGISGQYSESATYFDWMKQVNEAVKLGLRLGDRILFYGHSTGGLLAYWYSSLYPNHVAGQFLISPAFRLSLLLRRSVCALQNRTQEINFFLNSFYQIRERSRPTNPFRITSARLGCEVKKFADLLFPEENINLPETRKKTYIITAADDLVLDLEFIKKVSKRLMLPTYIVPSRATRNRNEVWHGSLPEAFRYRGLDSHFLRPDGYATQAANILLNSDYFLELLKTIQFGDSTLYEYSKSYFIENSNYMNSNRSGLWLAF